MTGSLRLSALLLLLLSRWASADLEKGEDEFVRSWVIIEEQLVPPSRDELLQIGSIGGGGGVANRRITPKSVFVAPSFNKCSDGYRPDSMGRCVKVVKLNQAAQWDFLLKQLNSMYGPGGSGAFPVPSGQYRPAATMTTTTTEPPFQKTDSPGPFQLNIPLAMESVSSVNNQTSTPDEDGDEITTGGISSTTTVPANATATVVTAATTITTNNSEVTDDDGDPSTFDGETTTTVITTTSDDDDVAVTVTDVTTDTFAAVTGRPRPYGNRYHHIEPQTAATANESSSYSTTFATDTKTKYVENTSNGTTSVETEEDSSRPARITAANGGTVLPSTSSAITTTAVDVTETEDQVTTKATTAHVGGDDEENVVTVLAVAAADVKPPSGTRLPVSDERTQPQVVDTVTPEYYDDQPEVPTSVPENPTPDCSSQDAYRYYAACAGFRQQQQQQQLQFQQQLLIQQQLYQQQQHQQQQQQQQFFNQHQQFQQPHNTAQHATNVKRPAAAASGGVHIRFPEEEDDPAAADNVNLIRFPGPAPYRTTNKMFESSRHPTWWPTGWPEQQQNPEDSVQQQQHQQPHRIHQPQQKPDVRYWEFGSRLPKTSAVTTTTAVPPPPPPPPPPPSTQWFRRYF